METEDTGLSRISKLFIDRDQMTAETALAHRQQHAITLLCGQDVASSYTLQLAVLTAARIASRCFHGAVRIAVTPELASEPLLLWRSLERTFGQELASIVGPDAIVDFNYSMQEGHTVIFGDAPSRDGALRVTFDGWIAEVGPASSLARLREREYCTLSGVLAAALAISEVFLSFAEMSAEAARRNVGLSLWRPDLNIADPDAIGIPVEFLPGDLWVLGLGHLGNGYLWSLATLPYQEPSEVEIFLNDFDKVETVNIETGLVFGSEDEGSYKTRACSKWLETRGFRTRIIERVFDAKFRCRSDEPVMALCGFDSNPARRDLGTAGFPRVLESGLGGSASSFDTISIHTLPNPRRPDELWPDLTLQEEERHDRHHMCATKQNPGYLRLADDDCGRLQLARKAVAVPFVGAAAGSLVVAEAIRILHGGPAYTDIKLQLGVLNGRTARSSRDYGAQDTAGLKYCCRNTAGETSR